MQVDTIAQTRPIEERTATRQHLNLSTFDLLQLGLSRVCYVTEATNAGGRVEIVVHAANGMAVAKADSVDQAVELADHLGLALVAVH
jgi:hypothetical protein